MDYHGSMRCFVFSAVLLLGALPVAGLPSHAQEIPDPPENSEDAPVPAARQNVLLRDFFLRLFPGVSEGRVDPDDLWVERFVDRQIDVFVEEIDRSLTRLMEQAELIVQLRERTLSAEPAVVKETELSLRAALRRLASDCGSLAGRLNLVFPTLRRKSRIPANEVTRPDPESEPDRYELLVSQIAAADRMVRQYLFTSNSVVELADLQGEDMLVRLESAQQLARELSR